AATAEDLVTASEYTPFGELHRTILPEGNVIEYGYDTRGRMVSIERKPDRETFQALSSNEGFCFAPTALFTSRRRALIFPSKPGGLGGRSKTSIRRFAPSSSRGRERRSSAAASDAPRASSRRNRRR
ncbi:MAG: RHS repeat protein, partial [bacterium]|nr:RHS repeat protein [bacterium]